MVIELPTSCNNRIFLVMMTVLVLTGTAMIMGCGNRSGSAEEINTNAESLAMEDASNGLPAKVALTSDKPDLPKTTYTADMDNSSIAFRTRHWDIVDLIGWFGRYEIVMYADKPDFSDAVIMAVVDPTSIMMPNEKRSNVGRMNMSQATSSPS